MSKLAEYRVKAAEHLRLAESCVSEEAREVHLRLAAWFLALADDERLESHGTSGASQPIQAAQLPPTKPS
jgi:hypothetical protein